MHSHLSFLSNCCSIGKLPNDAQKEAWPRYHLLLFSVHLCLIPSILVCTAGLACRSLDPTKIILTTGSRLRLSCLGVMDVIMHENSSGNMVALIQHYQQEDLTALGKLVLALACKSTMAVQRENISTALDVVTRSYTLDLRNLIM